MATTEIRAARSEGDYAVARALIVEYAAGPGVGLCFQDLAAELDALPAMYGDGHGGCLLLGWLDGVGVGCVGVRRLSPRVCEMKRLYVRAQCRGNGLGRQLAVASIAAARDRGYVTMELDTLATMIVAQKLYSDLGFKIARPPDIHQSPPVIYLALNLND